MKYLQLFLILILVLLFFPDPSYASSNQFITLINPVRVSRYNPDPLSSINAQYKLLNDRHLPTTWLLTYDVVALPDIQSFSAVKDPTQEFGIWLEVTPNLASESGVMYVQSDSWHRAKSIFLSGYSQPDRLKLIDTVFAKFKAVFGFYPKSIGSWWVDSYSLTYLQQKYGVTANLGVADQFSTDGYHVWGQYWAAPFYPSKMHTAFPAPSLDQKVDIVNLQWAPRDPVHGYGPDQASLYSSQDFYTIGKDFSYLKQLIQTYGSASSNGFGQFTIGLEGDMEPKSYSGIYASILNTVQALSLTGYRVTNMQQFALWYRQTYPSLSPPYYTVSPDLLGSKDISIWYQSSHYRIGLLFNQRNKTLAIRDLRIYPATYYEPYFKSPNTELDLFINTPSIIDSASNPSEEWQISDVDLVTQPADSSLKLLLGADRTITLKSDQLTFSNLKLPDIIHKSPLIQIQGATLAPQSTWGYALSGYSFHDLTIEATYFRSTTKVRLAVIGYLALLVFITMVSLRHRSELIKLLPLFILFLGVGIYIYWSAHHQQTYAVSNDEVTALQKLSTLPSGRVVVYDHVCLQCHWTTDYKPAVFANKRAYVGTLSHKPIVYSKSVFESPTREQAKSALDKLNAKYIYTVKYSDYLETPPFSPGDLGIEKIFENSSSQIWQIK